MCVVGWVASSPVSHSLYGGAQVAGSDALRRLQPPLRQLYLPTPPHASSSQAAAAARAGTQAPAATPAAAVNGAVRCLSMFVDELGEEQVLEVGALPARARGCGSLLCLPHRNSGRY